MRVQRKSYGLKIKKKGTMLPNNEAPQCGDTSFAYWQGTVDSKLIGISTQVTEVCVKLDAYRNNAEERIGTIISRVQTLESCVQQHEQVLQKVPQIEANINRLDPSVSRITDYHNRIELDNKAKIDKHEQIQYDDFLSWKWVREKLGVPILVSLLAFLITVICPAVLILAYLFPRIIESVFGT
jgi:hypothetical protein